MRAPENWKQEMQELQQRVTAIEGVISQLPATVRQQVVVAAHELRDTENFAKPAWQKGADHMAEHWQGKVARWTLRLVLSLLGSVMVGLLVYVSFKLGLVK